jgi:cysteine desulfurase
MSAGDQTIYVDNNATTQLDPAVVEEMLPFLTTAYANPSSGYQLGMQVR